MKGTIIAALGVFLCTVTTATALDVQGVWSGTQYCRYFDGSRTSASFPGSAIGITQTGTTIDVDVDGITYRGTVIDSSVYSGRGEVGLTACSPSIEEVVRAGIWGDRLKGVSVFRLSPSTNGMCRWVYRRISTTDPGVTPCP